MTGRRITAALVLGLLGWLGVAGCGEKIAIPEATGLYSVRSYHERAVYPVDDARSVAAASGNVFVLTGQTLFKRNQAFATLDSVVGFGDARDLCVDDGDSLVFVWDQGSQTLSWFRTRDLSRPTSGPSSAVRPEVASCAGLATSQAGIDQVPGAVTYVYLSDPVSGVVWRYAYELFTGLSPRGILCSDDGEGARFIKEAAGLARDAADSLLVCDRDPERHWVVRFNAVPSLGDTSGEGADPLRGQAALFGDASCNPPAAADYVLGDAASCGQDDWTGGASDALGAFDRPVDVAVDGSGRIFVADRGNHRFQVFTPTGAFDFAYGDSSRTPSPRAIALMDETTGVGTDEVNFAAYVWLVGDGVVRKFISSDHYQHVVGEPPPPQ